MCMCVYVCVCVCARIAQKTHTAGIGNKVHPCKTTRARQHPAFSCLDVNGSVY